MDFGDLLNMNCRNINVRTNRLLLCTGGGDCDGS